MNLGPAKIEIASSIERRQRDFWKISDTIWTYAELGLQEFRSSSLLADTLEKAGFMVERGVGGMPTAFVAEWRRGTGKPAIGFTTEYDALAGMSQKAGIPAQDPLVPGAPGHGCSHNTMGPLQILAAVSLAEIMARRGVNGTLRVFGCPAEELGVSRPYMIRAGAFEGLDAVIDCHPDSMFKATYGQLGTALFSFLVSFQGRAAHAGWTPWLGRSAADAVHLMQSGVEHMREHLLPTNRVHWITVNGGDAPNIVPEKASAWYYVRDTDENIEAAAKWVWDCAKGAALMTQTEFEIQVIAAVHQRFYNQALANLIYRNLRTVGKPEYSEEEDAFARAVQRKAGYPEKGMEYPLQLIAAEEQPFKGSSSDVGDVTLVAPTSLVSYPVWVPGSPAHHWTVSTTAATSISHKGLSAGAKAGAFTAWDLLTHPPLLAEAQEEFAGLTQRRPYKSFLPEGARPPLDFYSEMMEKYRTKMDSQTQEAQRRSP